MEYYQEVVVADSVAALRSSQDARGEIFWIYVQNMWKY